MNQACSFWDSCCSLWLHYIKRALYLESKTIFVEIKVVHWFRGPGVTWGKVTLVLLLFIQDKLYSVVCLQTQLQGCNTVHIVLCLQTQLQGCNTVYSFVCLQTNCRVAIQCSVVCVHVCNTVCTVLFACRRNCTATIECTVLFVCRQTSGLQYSAVLFVCMAAIQCAQCCLSADTTAGLQCNAQCCLSADTTAGLQYSEQCCLSADATAELYWTLMQ